MTLNRYAKKRDANESPIIKALEACGCSVEPIDVIDLLVERAGKLFLLEVKGARNKRGDARRLTPRQVAFRRRFTVHVVVTPADALRAVGLVDMRARVEANAAKVHAIANATVRAALASGTTEDLDGGVRHA